MDLAKFELDILNFYTYKQLIVTKENLNFVLASARQLKDIALTMGDTLEAVAEEKIILNVCDNLDMVDIALEGKVKTVTTYGDLFLN